MVELILITESRGLGNPDLASFVPYAIRLASDDVLRRLLEGTTKAELPPSSVMLWEQITPGGLGHANLPSLEEAIVFVKKILNDKENKAARAGFSGYTPIYVAHYGQPPQLVVNS